MPNLFAEMFETRFGMPPAVSGEVNATLAALLEHRSHRVYTDQPVSDETLQQLLAATFSAPSKSDLQQASVIHVRNPEKRQAIAALVPGMPWIAGSPEFFIFCADGRRIQRLAELRGKPFANDNLDNFLAAVCDTGLVMQAFITAADSMGLGTCPISVIRDHMAAVTELLGLPERVVPVAGMCLGYPARQGFVSMRLPLSVTCHIDTYDDSNLADLVEDYDQRREARFVTPPERQKYQSDYGIAAFYGWSEDKARQMSKPERRHVGDYVRSHGFGLA